MEKKDILQAANDGGNFLLRMRFFYFPFENKLWSTEELLQRKINDLQQGNISYSKLNTLTDVDTEKDWIKTQTISL